MIRYLMIVGLIGAGWPTTRLLAQDLSPEAREWIRDAYVAPRDHAQLLDCEYRVVTRSLVLDSAQQSVVRVAVKRYRDVPFSQLRRAEILERIAVRDSTIRAILRTKADSAQYNKNLHSSRDWWHSGACNGKPTRPAS